MSVKTIPYSQFKQYLAAGEVAECEVKDPEITGRIVPKKARPKRRPRGGQGRRTRSPPAKARLQRATPPPPANRSFRPAVAALPPG